MITFVVCSYNDSHFLPKAIGSCLSQPIENFVDAMGLLVIGDKK